MNITKIFENNENWIAEKLNQQPDYFKKLAEGQSPKILYIGCSDSRVTAEELMGASPGEVFVHRNIANMVVSIDMNVMSVINYAVGALNIEQIIVCGHYGCGGVKAAMGSSSVGIIDNWIRHIKDTYRLRKRELEAIEDEKERFDRLVEFNVKYQVLNMAFTSIVQSAWKNGQELAVHGWVYELQSGYVKDLGVSFSSYDDIKINSVYKLDF